MIALIVGTVVDSATELLTELATVFGSVIELVFDFTGEAVTPLGEILLITAGFALAYAGIRFVFGLVSRLTGAVKGGGR